MIAGKRSRPNSVNPFWRILISLIGLSMVFLGIGHSVLFFVGDTAIADVKTRRFGGSSDQYPASGRYEWEVAYTFKADNGGSYQGHTRRRGSDTGASVERTVYYLPQAPIFNALENEVRPSMGQLALLALGVFLIVVMNKTQKPSSPRSTKARRAKGTSDVTDVADYDDSVAEELPR
ncbi:MAG: hypothetical protein ACYC4L_15360 [Chloroflexota bacterium]